MIYDLAARHGVFVQVFLPGSDRSVTSCFSDSDYVLHEIDLREGAVLETGCVYLVCLQESLFLPSGISALVNPKSSTGRIDVFTRVIFDYARYFDKISDGYSGHLWLEISPRTFPIIVHMGSRLSQIRFRHGGLSRLSNDALERLHAQEDLVCGGGSDIDGGIALSVDILGSGLDFPIGFCARPYSGLIDVDKKSFYSVLDYWEPLYCRDHLVLDPGRFYILASRERVRIPPSYAAEMTAFDPLMGEFRVHYAGFFDPGFGHDCGDGHDFSDGVGSRAVLEVRSYDIPFILEDGQLIGRLCYESLIDRPRTLYSRGSGAHYQGQGLKLSKHFKPFTP